MNGWRESGDCDRGSVKVESNGIEPFAMPRPDRSDGANRPPMRIQRQRLLPWHMAEDEDD